VVVGFRLIAALLLLGAGGLMILDGVVVAASNNAVGGIALGLLGFVVLGGSVWLLRATYERLRQ
jgi:hypothetical protein